MAKKVNTLSMKTFKDLQVGDKIYIGFYAEFVQYVEYVEGYLHIHYFSERKKPKDVIKTHCADFGCSL